MKTLYKNLKYFYFFLILTTLATSPSAHAGLGRTIIDMLIDRIPFLGKAVSEYRLEHKVDRLGQVQRTGLDQLRALAKQAIKNKRKSRGDVLFHAAEHTHCR